MCKVVDFNNLSKGVTAQRKVKNLREVFIWRSSTWAAWPTVDKFYYYHVLVVSIILSPPVLQWASVPLSLESQGWGWGQQKHF